MAMQIRSYDLGGGWRATLRKGSDGRDTMKLMHYQKSESGQEYATQISNLSADATKRLREIMSAAPTKADLPPFAEGDEVRVTPPGGGSKIIAIVENCYRDSSGQWRVSVAGLDVPANTAFAV